MGTWIQPSGRYMADSTCGYSALACAWQTTCADSMYVADTPTLQALLLCGACCVGRAVLWSILYGAARRGVLCCCAVSGVLCFTAVL